MLILGIESSCDETAASVARDHTEILSNVVSSQVEEHKLYGGVVPEIASRRHCENVLPVVQKALDTLSELEVPFEAHVYSAHRTPEQARSFALSAKENGFGVLIAAAGKAAHLAGSLAACTTLPVVGIPIKSSTLDGMDALLSTVQMPAGIPVATVAIDGAVNAALLSAQILALEDEALAQRLEARRKAESQAVLEKDAALSQRLSGR